MIELTKTNKEPNASIIPSNEKATNPTLKQLNTAAVEQNPQSNSFSFKPLQTGKAIINVTPVE